MGNGRCGQFVTHCLCHSFLLMLFPCSSVGSLPQGIVLHKLLQSESFPWAAVLHELPQRGSLPRRAVLQEQAAPAWVLHRVTSPASKPAPVWPPLSTGPQLQPKACYSTGFKQVQSLLQAHPPAPAWGAPRTAGIYLLHCGPPWAAGGQPDSPWSSPPCATVKSLLQHLEHLLLP